MTTIQFRKEIYRYFRNNCRKFPWRNTKNPYHIFVSEVMLQQTQTSRVVDKYKLFIKTFPKISNVAGASFARVLRVWQGLGYNRRAMYIWRSAKIICKQYHGRVPSTVEALSALPGIGQNTAGAIVAFAFNKPAVFVETNIRSVFLHFFFKDRKNVKDSTLRLYIQKTLDISRPREWYFALMDYGAMLKKRFINPSRNSAHYKKQKPFFGSDRQIRGMIIRELVSRGTLVLLKAFTIRGVSMKRLNIVMHRLIKEGLVKKNRNKFIVANK